LWEENIMKKVNLLFDILYFAGIGLAFALFYNFVPEVNRTRIAWLNLGIGLLIYTGYLGRLMALFRPITKFADSVPFFAVYWVWWGAYVTLAVSGMISFHLMDMTFRKQALLQGVILFLFLNVVAFGAWGAAWMARSSAKDKRCIDGVRNIQYLASTLRVSTSELPMTYITSKNELEAILDDINCIPGSGKDEAICLEEKIAALIAQANHAMLNEISENELMKIIKELRMTIAKRKLI
jgi:hypothetical protein